MAESDSSRIAQGMRGGFLAGLAMGVAIARGTAYEVPTRATGLGRWFWIQAITVIAMVLWMLATIVSIKLG